MLLLDSGFDEKEILRDVQQHLHGIQPFALDPYATHCDDTAVAVDWPGVGRTSSPPSHDGASSISRRRPSAGSSSPDSAAAKISGFTRLRRSSSVGVHVPSTLRYSSTAAVSLDIRSSGPVEVSIAKSTDRFCSKERFSLSAAIEKPAKHTRLELVAELDLQAASAHLSPLRAWDQDTISSPFSGRRI